MSSRPCCRHGSVFAPVSYLKGLVTHHCPMMMLIVQYELPCMLQRAPFSLVSTALSSHFTLDRTFAPRQC